jgi:hypothetical protein
MSDGQLFAALFGGLILFLGILFAVIWTGAYYGDRSTCATWAETTGRETKFSVLLDVGVPLSWDCFTPDEDGRWIPTSRVRDID